MSGGRFEYNQHKIFEISETIQSILDKQGKLKDKSELYGSDEYYKKYPEELYEHTYSEEVQEKMRYAVKILKEAYVYAHRIDWLLSSDDSEEAFLERLDKEIKKIGQ